MPILDFTIDILCMVSPIDQIDAIPLTRNASILISLGAISLLVMAITVSALKEAFPVNTVAATVAAGCIVGIGIIGLGKEMLTSTFLSSYPPMIIVLRLGQGLILGSKASRHLRWWHSPALAGLIALLYYVLKPLPSETLALVKSGWALFGVGLAALMWTRMMAGSNFFRGPFITISTYLVFASTILYVSVSPFERILYQWFFPIGFIGGMLGSLVSPQKFEPHDDSEPNTDEI